ncbi:flagellar hook-associated protein FlgL [Georgenia sp. AZ-5]|uniref:flagellar hook-associated protein FlgL n=1 Tax=Georgenia sp. AZ-5 TaxID=3367526 RepID=UPI00375482EB
MITRVTQQTQALSAQRNLQTGLAEMARLQEQATSQKKLARPSDDPVAAADAMRVRAGAAAENQYGRNIDDGNGWLTTIDSALNSSLNVMHRVRDLVLQGASETSSPASREALALEIEELREELLGRANTKYMGRTVFAGTSDAGVAFTEDLSFTGVAGSSVQRRLGPDTAVRVDADGAAIFGEGAGSVFALLDTVVADLRGGGKVSNNLDALDGRMKAMVAVLADVGARHAHIEKADTAHREKVLTLETQRSRIEDVDMAEAIMDLQLQELSYQAALGVTAKVLQPTLMDFLA